VTRIPSRFPITSNSAQHSFTPFTHRDTGPVLGWCELMTEPTSRSSRSPTVKCGASICTLSTHGSKLTYDQGSSASALDSELGSIWVASLLVSTGLTLYKELGEVDFFHWKFGDLLPEGLQESLLQLGFTVGREQVGRLAGGQHREDHITNLGE